MGHFKSKLTISVTSLALEAKLSMKAETFVHYFTSAKQLVIVDIQRVNYVLCDPEISSSTLMARDETILFCL